MILINALTRPNVYFLYVRSWFLEKEIEILDGEIYCKKKLSQEEINFIKNELCIN